MSTCDGEGVVSTACENIYQNSQTYRDLVAEYCNRNDTNATSSACIRWCQRNDTRCPKLNLITGCKKYSVLDSECTDEKWKGIERKCIEYGMGVFGGGYKKF